VDDPPGCSPAPTSSSTSPITATRSSGEQYLELALRFGRLQPDLIDSYCGPAELRAQVETEPPSSYERLAEEAAGLNAEIAAGEPDDARRGWLTAQLTGLETACRCFAGDEIPYAEQVRRCHQVEARLVPEEEFAAAHARLDDALPGDGPLNERFNTWRESQHVPRELIGPGLKTLAAELRERTAALVELPDGDHVDFVLVTDKPWQGFCDYLGDLRTRISINVDLPIPSADLFELVTHEVYPGHHTEHVCKEPLIAEQGRSELAVFLFPTPHSVVAEGIATTAHEALFGEDADRFGAEILRPLGIPYDAETAAAVRATEDTLKSVGPNLVQLLAESRISRDEARPYARRWLLGPDKLVDKALEFYLDGPWPPYGISYAAGMALARGFFAGDAARFRRLLSEQLTPDDLAA
jgi:hypothetical protein